MRCTVCVLCGCVVVAQVSSVWVFVVFVCLCVVCVGACVCVYRGPGKGVYERVDACMWVVCVSVCVCGCRCGCGYVDVYGGMRESERVEDMCVPIFVGISRSLLGCVFVSVFSGTF